MADVRSMLRQQRASRQQAQKPPKPSAAPAAAPSSKKRKITDDVVVERKRTRTEEEAGVPAGFFDASAAQARGEATEPSVAISEPELEPVAETVPTLSKPVASSETQPPPDPEENPELDAFLEQMNRTQSVAASIKPFASGIVIESAPMTAAEIAAKAREEQSAQRAKRDEEMEGEKEDAARALEEEFEEMEGLEERVKKLREQREALRTKQVQPVEEAATVSTVDQPEVEEDSGSEDENWDDWRFHPA